MSESNCEVCGVSFSTSDRKHGRPDRFCSQECLVEWRGREKPVAPLSKSEAKDVEDGVCPFCESEFSSAHAVKSHVPAMHGKRIGPDEITCVNCGEVKTRPSWQNNDPPNYCSYQCMGEGLAVSGEDHPMYGKTGIDSPNFKHGLSIGRGSISSKVKTALPNHWQTISEQEREGEVCYVCGKGEKLHTHHIIPVLAGGVNESWNLMVLCHSCHKKVESKTAEIVDYCVTPDEYEYDVWRDEYKQP